MELECHVFSQFVFSAHLFNVKLQEHNDTPSRTLQEI
jgi:hypothetical protein